jgi:hypothetical protein
VPRSCEKLAEDVTEARDKWRAAKLRHGRDHGRTQRAQQRYTELVEDHAARCEGGKGLGAAAKPVRVCFTNAEAVGKLLNIDELPKHVHAFGEYMAVAAQKPVTARRVIKAYVLTRSSMQRASLPAKRVTEVWPTHPPFKDKRVRPEDVFAVMLTDTRAGQRYLDEAEKGRYDAKSANWLLARFKPFGLTPTMRKDLRSAVKLGREAERVGVALRGGTQRQWFELVRKEVRGIDASKVGFLASLLGRGDIPTFDAREREIWVKKRAIRVRDPKTGRVKTVKKVKLPSRIPFRLIERLASRMRELRVKVPKELAPYYEHLVHHAVWDRAGGTQTTHAPLIRCMELAGAPRPVQRLHGFTGLGAVSAAKVKNYTQEIFERYPGKKLAQQIQNSAKWGSAGAAGADLRSQFLGLVWQGKWDASRNQFRVSGPHKTQWYSSSEQAAKALRRMVRADVKKELEKGDTGNDLRGLGAVDKMWEAQLEKREMGVPGPYYYKDPPRLVEIIQRWKRLNAKLVDESMPLMLSLKEVWPHREFRWTREQARRSPEEWDTLEEQLQKEGWNPRDPLILDIGREGGVKVAEGNHRLAIARALGIKKIPVRVFYAQGVVRKTSIKHRPPESPARRFAPPSSRPPRDLPPEQEALVESILDLLSRGRGYRDE